MSAYVPKNISFGLRNTRSVDFRHWHLNGVVKISPSDYTDYNSWRSNMNKERGNPLATILQVGRLSYKGRLEQGLPGADGFLFHPSLRSLVIEKVTNLAEVITNGHKDIVTNQHHRSENVTLVTKEYLRSHILYFLSHRFLRTCLFVSPWLNIVWDLLKRVAMFYYRLCC